MRHFFHIAVEPKMRKSEAQKLVDTLYNMELDTRRLAIRGMFMQTHGRGLLTDKGKFIPLDTFAGTT